jgi:hypothetical protein
MTIGTIRGPPSVNGITAQPHDDGSINVTFGGRLEDPNNVSIRDGWNYIVCLYRAETRSPRWNLNLPERNQDGTVSVSAVSTHDVGHPHL